MTDDENEIDQLAESSRELVLIEGTPTTDGRLIRSGAIDLRPGIKVSLMTRVDVDENDPGIHRDLVPCGVLFDFERAVDGKIYASVSPPLPEGSAITVDIQLTAPLAEEELGGVVTMSVAEGYVASALVNDLAAFPWAER